MMTDCGLQPKASMNLRWSCRGERFKTPTIGDTSFYADVTIKPNTQYRLSGWVKGRALRGKISFNNHIGRAETERLIRKSLLEPSKVLAKGYETLTMSPLPPMGDIFSPQELADIEVSVLTLK
jgi:hypothetical protein